MSSLFDILARPEDNFCFERALRGQGFACIAGTDEVGRGPLAGPVVAACVSLPAECDPAPFVDSKMIPHEERLELARLIQQCGAAVGIGVVSHKRIDAINILQASLLAMKLAVYHHTAVSVKPDYLLVDGKFEVPLRIDQHSLVKGEARSGSIAAASIMAKVYRDALMNTLHQKYPNYGFCHNKGYATPYHRRAIAKYGPCPIHRLSFKGVREFVC